MQQREREIYTYVYTYEYYGVFSKDTRGGQHVNKTRVYDDDDKHRGRAGVLVE